MRDLPLDPADLRSMNTLGVLASWMLAPDDPQWRAWISLHYATLEGLRQFQLGSFNDPRLIEQMVRGALAAPSWEVSRQEMERRLQRGYAAGMIVHNAIFKIQRGEPSPVGRTMKDIEIAIWGRTNSSSRHVNDAVWKVYRPVSAMWAAYIAREASAADDLLPEEFPCRYEEAPTFIAQAEAMRRLAESTVPPKRAEPLLPPDQAMRVSDAVGALLPAGTLSTTVPK